MKLNKINHANDVIMHLMHVIKMRGITLTIPFRLFHGEEENGMMKNDHLHTIARKENV